MKKAISLTLVFILLALALAACELGATSKTTTVTEAPARNTAEPEAATQAPDGAGTGGEAAEDIPAEDDAGAN